MSVQSIHLQCIFLNMCPGRASQPWNDKNVDWIPTLNLGHNKFDAQIHAQRRCTRAERVSSRRKLTLEVTYYFIYSFSLNVQHTKKLFSNRASNEK